MYRVVPTAGPDGKNLLKLLPVSESPGSFVPIVQSSAMANHSKANVSSPLHLPFTAQLAGPAAPSPAEAPALQSANPAEIVLTATLDKEESLRAGSEKESSVPKAAADSPGSCLSVEVVSVTSSWEQGSTAYMFVNTHNLPVTVKSPALPYGYHLQIPADAEVKSVPASSLPPSVQQKILETATSSTPGGAEGSKTPTVIYVSPVNTVKSAVPKCLRTLCSEQACQASKTLLLTPAQKERSSAEAVPAEGQQCQQAPMKWIVQEGPQAPALVPVKSSNSVASKILKTLLDMKSVEMGTADVLPLSSSGSQTKIMTTKENALVMCNGKVYLLARRGSDLSAQADKQASASCDASLRKDTTKVMDSAEANKTTDGVVNLLLCKGKGMLLPQKDPNSKTPSPIDLTNDLNSAPAVAALPSAHQQSSTANQRQSLPLPEGTCSGASSVPAVGTQQNTCQNGKERSPSPKAASAVLPQSEQEEALAEDCHKIPCVKMESPKKVTQSKLQEKPHWKQYLELRRQFGLLKEERVYLWRIPLPPSWEEPEEDCSNNSLSTRTDSCSSLSVDVETLNHQQECAKEEQVKVELEEDFSRKRKIKSSPGSEGGKRKRRSSHSSTSPSSSSESTNSAASVLSVSVPPAPVLPQLSPSTAPLVPSPGRDSEPDPEAPYGDSTDSQAPVVLSGESNSSLLEGSFRDDAFPWTPPDLDETIRDEKIKRLKQLLREREAALEEVRRRMQQS